MINQDKIEDWLREVEERPSSASLILRYIASRLSDLSARNEELLAENIELRTEKKIEEFENRIENLQYQIEILKRQLGGNATAPIPTNAASLLLYNRLGQVLRYELQETDLLPGEAIANIVGGQTTEELTTRMLATNSQEELLFVFDSGRTSHQPVADIPLADRDSLDWSQAFLQEPRLGEELTNISPIGKMSLYDFCVQTSRRGFVKKIRDDYFRSHVSDDYIGTGVQLKADKTYSLTFCNKDDLFVIGSREGFLLSLDPNRLPFTIEEVIRLSPTDHITTTFSTMGKLTFLVVTNNGKAIHREISWLEPANSFKSKGQSIFSKEKRASGVRIAGAAMVDEQDWGIVLWSDGKLTAHKISDLFSTGSLSNKENDSFILGFSAYRPSTEYGRKGSSEID